MEAGHRDRVRVEPLGELEARGDLRELALPVRARPAVPALELWIVEVDRRLAERGDVDDPGRLAALQQGEEAHGQQEAGEVVDREPQLQPVPALLARGPVGTAGADAGVADQDVELVGAALDLAREPPHLLQRRQIRLEGRRSSELRAQLVELLAAAAMEQDSRATRVQLAGHTPPEPVGGAGDEDGRSHDPSLEAIGAVCEHTFVRWREQEIDQDGQGRLPGYSEAVVRHFDAPEALDTRFYEVHAKSALNAVPKASRMPFRWTVNPYRGCSHACLYCFARPTHEYLDLDAGRDFEKEIVVKVNVPEVLRVELARPSWTREHVAFGTNTDPYQWVEGRYKLMRGIWGAMRDFANPCSILTKSPLLLRDKDLLLQIAERTSVSACLSVPTLDEKAWRATEPHTPHPKARLEAVAELNRIGIPTGILIAPLMPGINDGPGQVERIVALADEAGATSIGGQALFLRGSTKDVFFEWLTAKRPDLVEMYERLYRRGAYMPESASRELVARLPGRKRRGRPVELRFDRPPPALAPPKQREEVRQTTLF